MAMCHGPSPSYSFLENLVGRGWLGLEEAVVFPNPAIIYAYNFEYVLSVLKFKSHQRMYSEKQDF